MKIIVDEKNAFLHMKGNTFICLGPKKEVTRADPITLSKIVREAVAVSAYNDIQKGEGHTLN